MINISIIMPIFNTGQYLRESIGSILQQTYTEFELICVNDASSDNSNDILMEFQRKDDRIIIVNHETNCGAAASRNDGLKIARGEYVIFLDSDDCFYQDMLDVSYNYAVKENADIVIFGSETMENGLLKKSGYHFRCIDSVIKKKLFLPKVRHVPWDKLVKRKILMEHNIWFQDIPTNNDIFYSFATVAAAEKIIVCDRYLLRYRYGRIGSLTDKRFSKANYTIEAFYALFRFGVQNETGKQLTAVLLNLLSDNIQLYLSDETYPSELRRDSFKRLLGYEDLVETLRQQGVNNVLYPHNKVFVQKLTRGEDVCRIGYYQYYLEGVEEIIRDRRINGKKIALWGYGQNGKKLLKLLEDAGITIEYVVDENQKIQGERYGRYQIQSYDKIADEVATILITNLEYQDAIERRAVGKEVIYVWK